MPRQPKIRYWSSRAAYYTTFQGKQHLLAAGPEGDPVTVDRANKEFARIVLGVEDEKHDNRTPLSALFSRYLLWYGREHSQASAALRRYRLDAATPVLGLIPVGELSRRVVQDFLDSKTTWGRSTRAGFVATLQACLNWGVQEGEIKTNPLRGKMDMRRKGIRSRGKECLIHPDIHARLAGEASGEFADVLMFLHATGCRPGELCKLSAAYWSVARHCFVLPNEGEDQHKTAGEGKHRVIFVPPSVLGMVLRRLDRYPTGRIFRTEKGKPWTSGKIALVFNRLKKRLKLGREISPYGYRHGYATLFLLRGGPNFTPGSPAILAELLGTSMTMLQRHYGHLDAFRAGLAGYADGFDVARGELVIRDDKA